MKDAVYNLLNPAFELVPEPSGIPGSGTPFKGIRAAIFDIYGTLLISGSGDIGTALGRSSAGAFRKAFSLLGVEIEDPGILKKINNLYFSLIAESHGELRKSGFPYPEVDILEIWKMILDSGILKHLLRGEAGVTPETAAAAYESVVNPVYPMPGLIEILRFLRESNIKLGIISNAQFYTGIIFECLFDGGLRALGFEADLSVFSFTEKRAKPDPFLFARMSERLLSRGIRPSETLFAGNDILKDIMPAAAAGFKTVLFAGDKRSLRLRSDDEACKDVKPDVIVNNLLEIADFIQEG